MQPVKTVRKKGFSRKTVILTATAILLLLAASLFVLLRPSPETSDSSDDQKEKVLTLLDHDDALISKITVHPSRSDAYTLVKTEEGWSLEGDPDYPLREDRVRVLLRYAAHLTADELVVDQEKSPIKQISLSEYGLDPGSCTVDVMLTSGEKYTIILGSVAPMDEVRYYAKVSSNQNIYTVTSDVMDGLNVQFYALHPVTRPAIKADLIDRITLSNGVDDPEFIAARTASGWRMTYPYRYPLSGSTMNTLLSALENIRFSTWVAKDTPQNRDAYGFEGPGITISIDFAASVLTVPDEDGNEHTIELPESNITITQGSSYSDTADYYLYNGDIMTGTVMTFSFLRNFSWRKYAAEVPFIYRLNNLSEVVVTAGKNINAYSISYVERVLPNNKFERDENGNILYEMRVRKNEQPVDADAFGQYYNGLTALKDLRVLENITFFGDANGVTGQNEPTVTIRLSPEDHSEGIAVSLYPGPDGMNYLAVDGVAFCCVTKEWEAAMMACP